MSTPLASVNSRSTEIGPGRKRCTGRPESVRRATDSVVRSDSEGVCHLAWYHRPALGGLRIHLLWRPTRAKAGPRAMLPVSSRRVLNTSPRTASSALRRPSERLNKVVIKPSLELSSFRLNIRLLEALEKCVLGQSPTLEAAERSAGLG